MADITLSYKGAAIGELSASGTKTIKTAGKYCEDDITLTYVSPGGGGGGGGGSVASVASGVQFVDYDGTVVEAWPAADVAAKSALPDNPSHTGLTAQGWNWSLTDIKSFVSARSDELLTVGQMYTTASGDTEIDIELFGGRLSPYLGIAVNGEVEVDWGDDTATSTVTGSSTTIQVRTNHTYAAAGQYTIKIHVVSGRFAFHCTVGYCLLNTNSDTNVMNSAVYSSAVRAVRIGNNADISNSAFLLCFGVKYVTIPSTVSKIDIKAFDQCYSIESVTVPSGVTSIGDSAFNMCKSLRNIAIPNSVTAVGANAFYYCSSMPTVAIPSGVTKIKNYTFSYCNAMSTYKMPPNVTTLGDKAFEYCDGIQSVELDDALTAIGEGAFAYCYSMSCLTVPANVSSIATDAVKNCIGIGELHFAPTVPPVLSSANSLFGLRSDCIIYVPTGYLNTYKTATNYPDPAVYTYVEE